MIRSLKFRLLVGVLAAVTGLLALFGLGVYESFRRALMEEFDQSLVTTARTLAASVETEGHKTEMELDLQKLLHFQADRHDAYYQIWLDDDKTLSRSLSLGQANLPKFFGTLESPVFREMVLPSGLPGRAVGLAFTPRLANQPAAAKPGKARKKSALPQAVLVVAQGTSQIRARLRLLAALLSAAGAATMSASLAVMVVVVRRGLRPVRAMAQEIAAITSDDLAYRLPAAAMPTELEPVADKLNDLLARLEEAFKRERGFTSDVAHELRTPLAGMRSTLEVTLSRTRSVDDYIQAMRECQAIASQMQTMVESLLALARLGNRQIEPCKRALPLRELVDDCWKQLTRSPGAGNMSFENRLANLSCSADADCMHMVFANLLDNAVTYNCPGGRVWVDGLAQNGTAHISVSNTGCALPAEAAEQVFAPFWRGDPSRTMTGVHAGLGLSLVQRSVEAQGGTVKAIINEDDGIFTIRITLPGAKSRS